MYIIVKQQRQQQQNLFDPLVIILQRLQNTENLDQTVRQYRIVLHCYFEKGTCLHPNLCFVLNFVTVDTHLLLEPMTTVPNIKIRKLA